MMITPIQITKKDIGPVNIFTFIGAVDETNADATFKKIFNDFIGSKLIFDLGGLTYGNSKFLGYLSKMYEYIEEKAGTMYIINCVEPLRDVLDICGILKIIPNKATLSEALAEMGIQKEITTK